MALVVNLLRNFVNFEELITKTKPPPQKNGVECVIDYDKFDPLCEIPLYFPMKFF